MLRFAPSPTGDMHIGSLRVALFNYIVSQQKKEDLIIRIEDIDKDKNIEGKDKEILDILDLFGITYSQTIYQSESARFHSAMALQLIHDKKAFSCFCSWQWIQKKQEEAKASKKDYKYDDACANLPAELVIDNLSPFTIRIHKPTEDIIVKDYIQGETTFKPANIDSFMLLKQDKTPMYVFACAVDDMLSDISIVIRNEEFFGSAPEETHIRNALGYDKKVEYAHLPNIINDSDFSVKYLLEEGFLPEAISNYLISLGNKTPKEIFTLGDARKFLDFKNISKSPIKFDMEELRDINKKHLKALDAKELSRYVGFADAEIGELAKVYLEEVSTTKELRIKMESIFAIKKIPKNLEEHVTVITKAIKSAPYFDKYDDFIDYTMKESGLSSEDLIKPLRYVLTGTENGPDIAGIYKYIKNYLGEIVK